MPAAGTAITITTMVEGAALLRLLTWLSPAFPTGGFAWSHGVESAVEAGDIRDADTLRCWLDDVLRHGSGRSDAILLRHAHAASGDADALAELAELGVAMQPGRERRAETVGQGNAFVAASACWNPETLRRVAARGVDIPYPVAVGALAGASGIGVDAACCGLLQAFIASLVSAAVRLVPLGQSAGLAVLAALEPALVDIADATRGLPLDAIGGACFRADLFSLRHETQYTRLFRS